MTDTSRQRGEVGRKRSMGIFSNGASSDTFIHE